MEAPVLGELALAGLLFAVAVLPEAWRTRPRARDRSGLLLAAMPLAAILVPSLIISLSDNVKALHVADNNLLTVVVGGPAVLLLALWGVWGIRRGQRPLAPVFLIALQCGEAAVLALLGGQGWLQPLSAGALAVLAAFGFAQPGGARLLRWGATCAMVLLIVVLLVSVIADPVHFLGSCRGDKCSLAGAVLVQGVSGNNLGIYIAAFAPLALIGLRFRRFVPACIGMGLLVDLTSARAALFGFLAVAVVLALRHLRGVGRSRPVALVVLAAAVAVAFLPYYHDWGRFDFTWRGQLWARAKQLVAERPAFGWGPAYWTGQPRSPNFPNYGTHNAILEVLVSTGIVGLLLVLAAFVWMTITARTRALEFVALLVPVLVTGALESTLATQRYTILFGFLPVYLAIVYARQLALESGPRHVGGSARTTRMLSLEMKQ